MTHTNNTHNINKNTNQNTNEHIDITPIMDQIIEAGLSEKNLTKDVFHQIKNKIYEKHKIQKPLPNIQMLQRYNELIADGKAEDCPNFRKILRKRGVRSLSGVSVISLLTKSFGCPGQCIYCPEYEKLPKSYIPDEPAVLRAELNQFDPVKQIHNRLRSLEITGHKIEKNDVRIIGGTWSFYPKEYQEEFIKGIYDAFNSYQDTKQYIEETDLASSKFASFTLQKGYKLPVSQTLEEAKQKNVDAFCKVVGIAIETRPDWIDQEEIVRMRKYGVTRVEIGYQTTHDEINEKNKRGHGNKESIEATRLLKDAGFKVVAHMMPNLLGSTPDLDRSAMQRVFEDQAFRPDELKIYPMVVTDHSELTQIWKDGGFTAYDDETLIELMCDLELAVAPYCRINRTYRDIPADHILEGSTLSNLRQIVEQRIQKRGQKVVDIRSREIKDKINDPNNVILKTIEYQASGGKEYFLSFEDPDDHTLFSLLRLRIPSQHFSGEVHYIPELNNAAIIREIHTFGDQLSVGQKGNGFGQHMGFGKKLIAQAEKIIQENYPSIDKIAVISGVGVQGYYAKRGYEKQGEYMVKKM
ncbi:MAG: tRNA uridine(34) 5-carboxymethylaminomethyl modification radical SAM/GNAT enzyme Elp3 [Patescibacteria group bacterium]|nr:tRNA uridine(34) 5-carboxymethylaminomethyl modification radical SAM/GNAT enzyme Elp3 [Patescibacteria group bacterium]